MLEKPKKWIANGKIELLLFAGVLAVLLLRFGGLFRNEGLPGWDTPGHYFALTKMAEFLEQGRITGYLHEWLGGMPLFDFYAPLFFIVTAGFWLITFKLIPLFLLFRIAIFLVLLSVPVSFWFFCKIYFGKNAARFAIPLSLVFIFYPKVFSIIGTGAGAAIWVGLISSTIGASMALVWLGWVEKMRKQPTRGNFVVTSILLALLALTHTLSFIAASAAFGLLTLVRLKERATLVQNILSYAAGLGLSAFWMLPFLLQMKSTSAESIGTTAPTNRLFLLLFPLDFPYLGASIAVVFMLTCLGLWRLLKQKQYSVPSMAAGIAALILLRQLFALLAPNFTLHFTRLLPLLSLLLLSAATYGMHVVWQKTLNYPRGRAYATFLLSITIFLYIIAFDFNHEHGSDGTSSRQPLTWSWSSHELSQDAAQLVQKLSKHPDVQRVYVQIPSLVSLAHLGSVHFFSNDIPLQNRQPLLTGLYIESAPLTPYIMPTTEAATQGRSQTIGDNRIRQVAPFYQQPLETHFKRLAMLGVNYIAAYSPEFSASLQHLGHAELVTNTGKFTLWKTATLPLAYPAPYKPGVYFGNKVNFRDLSMAIFAGERTFDFPVVEAAKDFANTNTEEFTNFSIIFLDAAIASEITRETLGQLGKPVVILGSDSGVPGPEKNIAHIENFETISKSKSRQYSDWPAGWKELHGIIEQHKALAETSTSATNLSVWSDRRILFEGQGPIVINTGYSPYWQIADCKDCKAYRVTPDQLLVFANGKTNLEYRANNSKKAGYAISLLSLMFVLVHAWQGRNPAKQV